MKSYIFIAAMALLLSGCEPKHIVTDEGLHCAQKFFIYAVAISCNWEKYNRDTNFGKFPYATEE